jgi:hypothetical protein
VRLVGAVIQVSFRLPGIRSQNAIVA